MKRQILTAALATSALVCNFATTNDSALALAFNCATATTTQIDKLVSDGAGSALTSRVTPTTGCQISPEVQDSVSSTKPLTVNEENFFGAGWTFGGKINEGYGSGNGTGQNGLWNIAGTDAANATERLLIFKSGRNPLVGYLTTSVSGTWSTPFTSDVFDLPGSSSSQNLSHLSVYYRGDTQAVPTPAAVLPALFGMGAAAVRKKKNGAEATQVG